MRGIIQEHEKTFDENSLRDFIDAFIVEKRKGHPDFSVTFFYKLKCGSFVLVSLRYRVKQHAFFRCNANTKTEFDEDPNSTRRVLLFNKDFG